MRRARPVVALVAVLGVMLAVPLAAAWADVTSDMVAKSLERSVGALKKEQEADGSWKYPNGSLGMTALAVLALKTGGLPNTDPAVSGGVNYIRAFLRGGTKPGRATYEYSLAAMALAAVDPNKQKPLIAATARWLEKNQGADGTWNYGGGANGDNSNNQFAVLGLRAAFDSGVTVNRTVLGRAMTHFTNTQNSDGGWSYQHGSKSTGSMTCAALSSLMILGARLQTSGVQHRCGQYKEDVRIASGLNWMADNFSVHGNPGADRGWYHYYMYGMERVGIFSARRYIGRHDWYREGAEILVGTEQEWINRSNLPNLCFGILFLAKGSTPVVINKLTWPGHNSPHLYDVQNLTAFASERLGTPLAWQTVSIDDPLSELLSAPILFISGHDRIRFTEQEREKLAAFIDNGGVILAEACCKSRDFDEGFRDEIKRVLKSDRLMLRPIPHGHPIYWAKEKLDEKQIDSIPVEGIDVACRTSVFYVSNARWEPDGGTSCEWEKNLNFSHPHFKLGLNVVAYAITDQKLRGRLDPVSMVDTRERPPVHAGAFVFPQLDHEGDSDPHPLTGTVIMTELAKIAKMPVGNETKLLPAADERLFNYPFIYMTGRNAFDLTKGGTDAKGIEALRKYLTRGGFLLGDPCCSAEEFFASFEKMVKQIFPEGEYQLKPIKLDHEIFRAHYDVRRVRYRQSVLAQNPDLSEPIFYGAFYKGRLAVVLSKYDIGCSVLGFTAPTCKGYVPEDAMKLAINIILYAMTHN